MNFREILNKCIIRWAINFINFIKSLTNRELFELADGFFLGSLTLIIIKLFFRIFDLQLFWQINLFLLMGFSFFYCYHKTMFRFRLLMVKYIFKPFLGETFYTYEYWENDDYEYNVKSLLGLIPLPPTENNFHRFCQPYFQQVFQGLIFLRLIILKEPYLFIIIQNLCIFFLIVNKLLIISSLVSLTLAFSRICFFISDFNLKEFHCSLSKVEPLANNECVAINRRNVKIVTYWVIRELNDWNFYINIRRGKFYRKNPEEIYTWGNYTVLREKLTDEKDEIMLKLESFNPIARKYSEYSDLKLFEVVKKHQITKNIIFFTLLIGLSYLLQINFNGMYANLSPTWGISTVANKINRILINDKRSMWFKNKNKPEENIIKKITTGDPKIVEFSKREGIHPVNYKVKDFTGTRGKIIKTNESTIRQKEYPDYQKVRNPYGPYSTLSRCRSKDLNKVECLNLIEYLNLNFKDIQEVEKNFEVFHCIDFEREAFFKQNCTAYANYYKLVLNEPSDLIQPHTARVFWGFLDTDVSFKQALEGMNHVLKLHQLLSDSTPELFNETQIRLHKERLFMLTQMKSELLPLLKTFEWSETDNLNFSKLLSESSFLNTVLERNKTRSPVDIMRVFFSKTQALEKYQITDNYISNLNKIQKVKGGSDSEHFVPHKAPKYVNVTDIVIRNDVNDFE